MENFQIGQEAHFSMIIVKKLITYAKKNPAYENTCCQEYSFYYPDEPLSGFVTNLYCRRGQECCDNNPSGLYFTGYNPSPTGKIRRKHSCVNLPTITLKTTADNGIFEGKYNMNRKRLIGKGCKRYSRYDNSRIYKLINCPSGYSPSPKCSSVSAGVCEAYSHCKKRRKVLSREN